MPQRRPLGQEFLEVRPDDFHGGLLQHDFRQPDGVRVGRRALARPPRHDAAMTVIPGQQVGRVWRFLSLGQSDCYGHRGDDATSTPLMSKPARSFPRPLSDFMAATMSDALKTQGFASSEIIARWADIAGPEIAAHSEPMKINWPRAQKTPGDASPEPATLVLRVEGPAAREIQHRGRHLERLNRFFTAGDRLHALRQAPAPQGKAPARRPPARAPPPPRDRRSHRRACARRWAASRRHRESERALRASRPGFAARHCHNCPVQLANRPSHAPSGASFA